MEESDEESSADAKKNLNFNISIDFGIIKSLSHGASQKKKIINMCNTILRIFFMGYYNH
jgi:hypothetical protein